MRALLPTLVAVLLGFRPATTSFGDDVVPNADFTRGEEAPLYWTLSGGRGRWTDRDYLQVTGTGKDSNHWRSSDLTFEPGALYRFSMRARRLDGSGTVISGPAFANRDFRDLTPAWSEREFVFRVPENVPSGFLRVGQWQAAGTVQFDRVALARVLPVHRERAGLTLGEGESVRDGVYRFDGTFGYSGASYHRPLYRTTASFNTDRWVLGASGAITYRFTVPGSRITAASVSSNINYHLRGTCAVEVSPDLDHWRQVATRSEVSSLDGTVPDDLLPAGELYVRIRAEGEGASLQVNRVGFEARLDPPPPSLYGETLFAVAASGGDDVRLETLNVVGGRGAAAKRLRAVVRSDVPQPRAARYRWQVTPPEAPPLPPETGELTLVGGRPAALEVPLPARRPGLQRVALSIEPTGARPVELELGYSVSEFYRTDYGKAVAVPDGPALVWWCDATRKVPRDRPPPTASAPCARLSAARNDFEAVQIVVHAVDDLDGLVARVSDLNGPSGSVIPAADIDVLRVAYHFVRNPTDATGVRDWWPDALPPLRDGTDVAKGSNQPLWVLVHVPHHARAGDYAGTLSLSAGDWEAQVPIALHVWDFALPEENHIATAFGLSMGNINRYHQLRTEDEKRRVLDLYQESFSRHRISPYDPVPLDPIRVRFDVETEPPRARVDFSSFDPAMARALARYHFTNFRLPIQGMGGGTFHRRYEPRIGAFGEESREYQVMFSSYIRQLESHLRDRGWLDKAYVYWFDEPDPKDYDFVRRGMARLKKYAPGLRRMLTEEPCDGLAGAVDIWCPVSFNYSEADAAKRRNAGERLWWYVCTGPKAPYATLFIDHPATELRVWLWQSWKREITGVLVWQTNYWTSGAAFPDRAQNPYEDPMGYVSGYSTPPGVKRFWGNGDGRFVYPPESASVPGATGDAPVLEPPVSSIRWEMLREGIEDYEFLWLLGELVTKRRDRLDPGRRARYDALLSVPASISKDMTHFTTDPAPIYARRAEIAEAIEELAEP